MQERIKSLFDEFFESEQASGIILIIATAASLLLANSAFGINYLEIWHTIVGVKIGAFELYKSLEHWINDGLMALFFLMVGLEIEREIYLGELSTRKKALLPIVAAAGGMIMPALFYTIFNYGTPTSAGTGIPMATDIAFALGILSLLGNRVPLQLKIFLAALAIIDDLGSIIIIAIFYTGSFSFGYFAIAMAIFGLMILMNKSKINSVMLYMIAGGFLWFFISKSGIHASITGVLVAFAIPFRTGEKESPSYRLQHQLHKPVIFMIMPLFALANTGIILNNEIFTGLSADNSLGIISGLLLGKPIGVILFTLAALSLGITSLPEGVTRKHLIGIGFLAGIGFTMSIFINVLAFSNPFIVNVDKVAILISSITAAIIGYFILASIRQPKLISKKILDEPFIGQNPK